MNRRHFITLLGSAAAWPLAARAQQGNRVRRIGVLMPDEENDPVAKTYVSAFTQALADLGWTQPCVPVVYVLRGGLTSYTPDLQESFKIAVGLVGEILKGAKPADLPVRNPNKFDFVINLKTAKQLGLEIPPHLLVFANELIN
jgi:hypothetical protein